MIWGRYCSGWTELECLPGSERTPEFEIKIKAHFHQIASLIL